MLSRLVIIFEEQCVISLYYRENEKSNSRILLEAMHKGTSIGGQYSVQKHSAHIPKTLSHYHVYKRNKKLFSINIDGTAHDRSHRISIPNKVADFLRQNGVKVPNNNIIECLDPQEIRSDDPPWCVYADIDQSNFISDDYYTVFLKN